MSEGRTFLPTDLLALVSFKGSSYPNEAWTRERLAGESPALTLGAAFEHFLGLTTGRSAWISVRRGRLRGLVSARRRGGRQAWELDCLVDATPDHRAIEGLLEAAMIDCARNGAEKVFARLDASSELLPVMQSMSFIAYREEVLYERQRSAERQPPGVPLRPQAPGDSYLVYRLYNAAVPQTVRRYEAATFSEWQAAQERRWLKNGVQLVSEQDGAVAAQVSAARLAQGVIVDLLASPEALANAEAMIEAAVEAVAGSATLPIFVLASRDSSLAAYLLAAGFEPRCDYVSLLQRTTRPITLPKLLPAVAKTAVRV